MGEGRNGRGIIQGWGRQCRGRGSSGWNKYYGDTNNNKGLCSDLGTHIINYGQKVSADKMRTI